MKELTQAEAIEFAESGDWKQWNAEQIVELQLFQERLCLPLAVFHEAIEKVLGRSVWTHEFASSNIDSIRAEYAGMRPSPTMQDIIELIPKEKRIIIYRDQEAT